MTKVLVVDDNPVSRELVRELLEAPGLEILEAAHGLEALEKIRQAVPDLVLLDIEMPLLDGFAVLERVRRQPELARVRVVALTAFAMRGDRQRALEAGFDDYITKPVDGAALRMQVRALLGARSE
jgi:CheY-like chemotaxis protein